MTNSLLSINLSHLRESIRQCELQYHRIPGSVKLLAVSKQQSIVAIKTAIEYGVTALGENYLQEAVPKIMALAHEPIEWHFIGKIQSNKTASIATHFSWVQSIDRIAIAERLQSQRPSHLPPLNCLIQVNSEAESQKNGCEPNQVHALAQAIAGFPNLRLRGLMAIPRKHVARDEQRLQFEKITHLFHQLQHQGLALDVLSIGMSHDYPAAIAAGSTMIRIGTAIFGTRN